MSIRIHRLTLEAAPPEVASSTRWNKGGAIRPEVALQTGSDVDAELLYTVRDSISYGFQQYLNTKAAGENC